VGFTSMCLNEESIRMDYGVVYEGRKAHLRYFANPVHLGTD